MSFCSSTQPAFIAPRVVQTVVSVAYHPTAHNVDAAPNGIASRASSNVGPLISYIYTLGLYTLVLSANSHPEMLQCISLKLDRL